MGGPHGCYAKWDKSEKKNYDFTHVEFKKKCSKIQRMDWLLLAGVEGWAKWVRGVKKYKFSVVNKAFGYYLQYGDNSQYYYISYNSVTEGI